MIFSFHRGLVHGLRERRIHDLLQRSEVADTTEGAGSVDPQA